MSVDSYNPTNVVSAVNARHVKRSFVNATKKFTMVRKIHRENGCSACLPRHVAIAIDLSDVAACPKECSSVGA